MGAIKTKYISKKIAYFLGAFFAGLLKGFILSENGAFQDTLIYYEYYNAIVSHSAYDAILAFSLQSAKFEPVLGFVFSLQSFLLPKLSERYFLIVNIWLITTFLAFVFYPYVKTTYRSNINMFMLGFLPAIGYLVLSKDLYVWRTIYAFCFFMLMINSKRKNTAVLFGGFAVLSHASALLFMGIYLICRALKKYNNNKITMFVVVVVSTLTLSINSISEYFSLFASGGDVDVFTQSGGEHTINVWTSIAFSFLLIALTKQFFINSDLKALWLFSVITIIIGLLSFEHYHFMNRVFVYASLIAGYVPFLVDQKSRFGMAVKLLIMFSILPSIRLFYLLFFGGFAAQ
jgi:hypothetical protein